MFSTHGECGVVKKEPGRAIVSSYGLTGRAAVVTGEERGMVAAIASHFLNGGATVTL